MTKMFGSSSEVLFHMHQYITKVSWTRDKFISSENGTSCLDGRRDGISKMHF